MRVSSGSLRRELDTLRRRAKAKAALHAKPLTPGELSGREAAENFFYEFVKQAWKVLEPDEFRSNWHVEEICRLLQELTEGKHQNVLINIPPGFGKSLIVSVMWPAWEWIRQPGRRYLASSHHSNISNRDTGRCRDLIKSDWYQNNWGHIVSVPKGEDRATQFKTTGKGWRRSTSVESGATGERGDTVIFDDPHDLLDAYRPARIAASIRHWTDVLSSRGVGEDTRYVVVMQRVAYRDVSSVILDSMAQGGRQFTTLILPMRYDPDWSLRVKGGQTLRPTFRDRRHRAHRRGEHYDEVLFKDMYPESTVQQMEVDMGDRARAILDQSPQEGLGSAFKRQDILSCFRVKYQGVWWYVLLDPEGGDRFYREEQIWKMISVDFATSLKETADFTSIGVYAITPDDDLLFIDHVHGRIAGPDIVPTVWTLVNEYNPHHVLMEKAGFQLSEIQRAYRQGMPVIPMKPGGRDKFMRSLPAQTRVRKHRFFIDEDLPARRMAVEEMVNFPDPNGHDDIVDQISYASEALALDLKAMSLAAQEELAASTGYERYAGPFGPGYSQF